MTASRNYKKLELALLAKQAHAQDICVHGALAVVGTGTE